MNLEEQPLSHCKQIQKQEIQEDFISNQLALSKLNEDMVVVEMLIKQLEVSISLSR